MVRVSIVACYGVLLVVLAYLWMRRCGVPRRRVLLATLVFLAAPLLMHTATGVVYSADGCVHRWQMFAAACTLHLINNAAVMWMVSRSDSLSILFSMQGAMLAAVVAGAFAFCEWSLSRPLAVPRSGDATTETPAAEEPLV